MPLDDLVLSVQRALDRLVRRLRRGDSPVSTQRRRFLIVQIDGLSRVVLEQALASGYMPFLKHMLERHGYRMEPMAVGLPTSTPAFQMAMMYGVRPDIPGFHYYDRERRTDVHFPRRGHAALVEARHTSGRRGILRGGSAYGCVFTGGADNNLFSFATLTRPTGRGLLCVDALEQRFPGSAEELSRSPGVGLVLARSGDEPTRFWRGKRYQLPESEPGPFPRRADAAIVIRDVADLTKMPSAGDLVIYGTDAPEGHVSFIPEMGAHAGPSPEELHTFIVHPAKVTLPSPITHPLQLYDHFIRYQERTA